MFDVSFAFLCATLHDSTTTSNISLEFTTDHCITLKNGVWQRQVAVVAAGCGSEKPFFNVLGLRLNDRHKNLQYQSGAQDKSLFYLKQLADDRDKSMWTPLGAEVNNCSSMSRNYGRKTDAS
jgi:hypothetical protein